MSNVFTLDSLREEADKGFAPFKIPLSDGTEATLRNLLRLNAKTREAVMVEVGLLSSGGDNESSRGLDEMLAACTKIVEMVSDNNGKKLLKEIDGDIALLLQVIKAYMEVTQLGEAEDSPTSSTGTASSLSPTSSTTTE